MVNIGGSLFAPESGWKRVDNLDPNISYLGTEWINDTSHSPYAGSRKRSAAPTAKGSIRFNFTGRNIRIIGVSSCDWSNGLKINIDGEVQSFSQYSGAVIIQTLNYQKLDLANEEHCVEITNSMNLYWALDAVDIDENGEIKPYNPNLPPKPSEEYLLKVIMTDSSEREYQLLDDEVLKFIKWINTHAANSPTSHKLVKKIGTQESEEYLVFDKIISFEVIKI